MGERVKIAQIETHDNVKWALGKTPPADADGFTVIMKILLIDGVYEVYCFPRKDTPLHLNNQAIQFQIPVTFVRLATAFSTIPGLNAIMQETEAMLDDDEEEEPEEPEEQEPEEPAMNPFQANAAAALGQPPNGSPSVGS